MRVVKRSLNVTGHCLQASLLTLKALEILYIATPGSRLSHCALVTDRSYTVQLMILSPACMTIGNVHKAANVCLIAPF